MTLYDNYNHASMKLKESHSYSSRMQHKKLRNIFVYTQNIHVFVSGKTCGLITFHKNRDSIILYSFPVSKQETKINTKEKKQSTSRNLNFENIWSTLEGYL